MENENNEYRGIDLLLEVLEEHLESSPVDVVDGNLVAQDNEDVPEVAHEDVPAVDVPDAEAGNQNENGHILASPIRVSARLKHMTSSSAKRKMIKQSNCCFCRADCSNAMLLEQHLLQNEVCFIKYSRRHHLTTLDGILSTLFTCLFCNTKMKRLFFHIQQTAACRERYFERFNCNSTEDVVVKRKDVMRPALKSRKKLGRQFENLNAKKRKEEECRDTEETCLNNFHLQTTFSNFRCCVSCEHNLIKAEEITDNDYLVQSGKLNLADKRHLRRCNKYWICSSCKSLLAADATEGYVDLPEPTIQMRLDMLTETGELMYFPVLHDQEDDEVQLADHQQLANVFLALPTSVGSLKHHPDNIKFKKLTEFQIQQVLNSKEPITKKVAGLIYENQLSKYQQVKNSEELLAGSVEDGEQIVTNPKTMNQDFKINGSDGWRQSQDSDVLFKMDQLGSYCLKFSCQFSYPGKQSVATLMLQEGHTVTASLLGDPSRECSLEYKVHLNHDSTSECSVNCPTLALEQYINNANPKNPDTATFISSVDQSVGALLKQLIKSSAFSMKSSEYHLIIKFDKDNKIVLEGLLWPECFREINLASLNQALSDEEVSQIRQDLLDNLNKSISTSSNSRALKAQFNLDNDNDEKLRNLVIKHQYHYCQAELCEACKKIELPSLEWIITEEDINMENVDSCQRLLTLMKNSLLSLSQDEVESMETREWIEDVWDFKVETANILVDQGDQYRIEINGEELIFKMTPSFVMFVDKYSYNPLVAIYHFSLMNVAKSCAGQIIIKRLMIKDCYVKPFLPSLLKALDSPIDVQIITSRRQYQNHSFNLDGPDFVPCLMKGLDSHIKVSTAEAFSLVDQYKLRVRASSTTEYIYSGPNPRKKFRKVHEFNANCVRIEGRNGFYEWVKTFIDRYFERRNGEYILLVELVCFYDFVGKEASKEKFELYNDRIDKIKLSKTPSISNTGLFLPELVLTNSGDVLQLRKKPKVLKLFDFQVDSYNFEHSSVLLYYPVPNYQDMKVEERVSAMFQERNQHGEKVVDVNKKMFLIRVRSTDSLK